MKKKLKKEKKSRFYYSEVNRMNLIPTRKEEYNFKRMKLKKGESPHKDFKGYYVEHVE